jgi:hypothetical protein
MRGFADAAAPEPTTRASGGDPSPSSADGRSGALWVNVPCVRRVAGAVFKRAAPSPLLRRCTMPRRFAARREARGSSRRARWELIVRRRTAAERHEARWLDVLCSVPHVGGPGRSALAAGAPRTRLRANVAAF